jgi:hypothetical protein
MTTTAPTDAPLETPDHPGIHERVTEHPLQPGACRTQRGSGERGQDHARQPDAPQHRGLLCGVRQAQRQVRVRGQDSQ